MPEIARGTLVAGHEIEAEIGRGQRGIVYRATDQRDGDGHVVALKVIRSDLAQSADFRAALERQFRAVRALDHPGTVPLHDVGYESGVLFTTMRYVSGGDLAAVLARGPIDPGRAARIVAQLAAALDAAHAREIVHRDVKPADVLLADLAGDEHAYLSGLELPKQSTTQGGVTGMGLFVGAVDYMAPEALEGGEVDYRADIYALGCLLYHAVTGTVPFPEGAASAKMYAHVSQPVPSVRSVAPTVARQLDEVIRVATAKDPKQRQARAGELGRAALAAIGGEGAAATAFAPVRATRNAAVPGRTELAGPAPTELAGPGRTELAGPAPTELAGPGRTEVYEPGATEIVAPARAPSPGRAGVETAAFALALGISALLVAVGFDLSPAVVILVGVWGALAGGLFRLAVADRSRLEPPRVVAIALALVASPLLFFWVLDISDRLALACWLAEITVILLAAAPAFTRTRTPRPA